MICYTINLLRKSLIKALLLLFMWLVAVGGWATDVRNAGELKKALGNATEFNGLVTLTADVVLYETIQIIDGTMTLVVPQGRTLTIDRTGSKEEAKGIWVNGTNAQLMIKGGGMIVTKARNGDDGADSKWGVPSKGQNGYQARTIILENGTFSICRLVVKAIPGNGGKGGKHTQWPEYSAEDGNAGTAWVIDAEKSNTIDDVIAYGSYFYDPNNVNYTEIGGGINGTSATISLTNYTVAYTTNGGIIKTQGSSSYTIETSDFKLPTVTKIGYDFVNWTYNKTEVKSAQLPTTEARQAEVNMEFVADWKLSTYKITYNLDNGLNPADAVSSYTYESETVTFPIPTKSGYRFLGWFETSDFSSNEIKNIPQGSIGDKTVYACWSKIYKIEYDLNGGQNIANPPTEYITEEATILPKNPTFANSLFKGWYTNPELTGSPVTTIEKNDTGDKKYYAKWLTSYTMSFDTNGGDVLAPINYAKGDTKTLNIPRRNGYTFVNWYEDAALTKEYGKSINPQSSGNIMLYAKWTPTPYNIIYRTYNGTNPPNAPTKYTIESESVTLPVPQRERYTFAGWCETDDLSNTNYKSQIAKGNYGDKTFYARWTAGSALTIVQPENGAIVVKNGTTIVNSGDRVGEKVAIVITATPTVEGCKLTKLLIGGVPYTTSPQDTVMPKEGLFITAEFTDTRPGIKSPRITTLPENTDYIPVGTDVKVAMQNQEAGSELFYSMDGTTPKKYTEPFLVSSATAKTVKISAIARKAGYKDGVTTRDIIFRSGKITISFNLPKGITATNPLGGEVVSAVASGGAFQFKLNVDEDYFETLDSLKVEANGKVIAPGADGVYTLSEQKANVTVKVTGITGTTYTISLTQTPHGRVFFTDADSTFTLVVNRGERVSVTAEADEDYKFVSWKDGSQANPREITAESNMTLQANFTSDADHYMVVFPEMEGVTVKTLTNYSQEVKRGGTCKFYLRLDADYSQSTPVVKANGEVLAVNKEVYSLYNITNNYSISVSGIRRNKIKTTPAENVSAIDVETATDASKIELLPEAMITLYAKAPAGKTFLKWNDGKTENPRIAAAQDVSQYLPLFATSGSGDAFGKVLFSPVAGAGVSAINANADAIKGGDSFQFKIVVLPQYNSDKMKVTIDDKEIKPELSLRASTETASYIYTLKNVSGTANVKVSGLVLNYYILDIEQKEGGIIRTDLTGSLKYGTLVTLTATPASGNMFVKWSDGNTLNPYPYKLTKDAILSAVFSASNSPVDNEIIPSSNRMCVAGNLLHLDLVKSARLLICYYNGQVVYNDTMPEGHSTVQLASGYYIVNVEGGKSMKIWIK